MSKPVSSGGDDGRRPQVASELQPPAPTMVATTSQM